MNATLKALIVWLVLLAVPIQGFAAATMEYCAPPVAVGAQQLHGHDSDDAPVLASNDSPAGCGLAAAANAPSHDDHQSHHHAGSKCNACAACCVGAVMPPSFATSLAVQAPRFESIPFFPPHLASADLALPERPPRA